MRTHSRSHNSRLALAALGVMAAVAAVASDAQPARPADASVSDGAPAAAPAPSVDIREIDFASLAQPGSACAQALGSAPPRLISVEQGASELLDDRSFSRLELKGDVLYADLDADGDDEAVLHAACTYGANGVQDTVQVWAVKDRLPLLVATIAGPPEDVAGDSAFPPSVAGVSVADDALEVTFSAYADDDPHCCPSEQTVVTYRLAGGLEVVGEPETGPVEE